MAQCSRCECRQARVHSSVAGIKLCDPCYREVMRANQGPEKPPAPAWDPTGTRRA